MAIVAEWMLGNTKITIYDDAYKDRSPEDIQRTLDNIARIAWKVAEEQATKQEAEEVKEAIT